MPRPRGWNPRAKDPGRHNTQAYDQMYYRYHKEMLKRNRRIRYRQKRYGLSELDAALLERDREKRGRKGKHPLTFNNFKEGARACPEC